jgi:hypothetical protein
MKSALFRADLESPHWSGTVSAFFMTIGPLFQTSCPAILFVYGPSECQLIGLALKIETILI